MSLEKRCSFYRDCEDVPKARIGYCDLNKQTSQECHRFYPSFLSHDLVVSPLCKSESRQLQFFTYEATSKFALAT